MCHVRSCSLPELQPKKIPAAPAKMKGGQVITRVMVLLKPRVLMTVGKNELNEQALLGVSLRHHLQKRE
jgi:hypothetical protein